MWVLLQFISGSIQKNALADFLPVMKLFDLLYPEKEVSLASVIRIMSSLCLRMLVSFCEKSTGLEKWKHGSFPSFCNSCNHGMDIQSLLTLVHFYVK